jgi:hypothetical protein
MDIANAGLLKVTTTGFPFYGGHSQCPTDICLEYNTYEGTESRLHKSEFR